MRRRDQTFLQCLPDSRAWRRLSSYISSHQTVGPGPLPSGLLGTCPVPTLPPPHCCLDMVGGPPAHFHARLLLPSAWPWRVVQGEEEPRRVPALLCAHHRGPRRWLPGTPHMAFPEPGGLCPVLLGPPGTGTSSDPAPRPCSGMRPGCGVTGRPVSAPPRVCGPWEGKGLAFIRSFERSVLLRRTNGQCEVLSFRREDSARRAWLTALASVPDARGHVRSQRGRWDQPHIPLTPRVTAWRLFISYLFEQSHVLTIFIDLFN